MTAQTALSDAELGQQAQRGNQAASTELWRRHSLPIRGLLARVLVARQDVDDALQDTFLIFFRGLGRLRRQDALVSYLIGIAVRQARDVNRRRRRRPLYSLEREHEHVTVADAAGAAAVLDRVLDRAGDDAKRVFLLHHVFALTIPEMAEKMNISVSTAKRRLNRANSRVALFSGELPLLLRHIAPRANETYQ